MADPFTLAIITGYLVKNAPTWLDSITGTLFDKGKDFSIGKTAGYGRRFLHLDEKEQLRHLDFVLKNAAERGVAGFPTPEERDRYREVLAILSEPGTHNDTLLREAMHLFTPFDTPNLVELNEIYNRSLRIRSLTQPTAPAEVDITPYVSRFFDALLAETYVDPFFHQKMSDVIKIRSTQSTQRSLTDVVTTLRQIDEAIGENYTPEQFEQDVQKYISHIERTLHYLKIIGVVPRDRVGENTDPELGGIFVPLRIAPQDASTFEQEEQESIVALLENSPYTVLLGGPGSGKSTVTRHLAWSHALANLPNSSALLSNTPLLSGRPLPLRIELRRLTEDRRQHPDYNFLSYATEVLLGREGIEIHSQMFKELLERRTMLLLFDGLDEVATLDERSRLVEEIEHFTQSYPGNRVFVTSRPVGNELTPFSGQWFTYAQVQEFNDDQIQQFLVRWYEHALRLSPIPHADQQELEVLYRTLQDNPRLHTLATNPLLLTVMTILHRYKRLPEGRVQLYDWCADLLLENWAKLKGTDARWNNMKMIKEDQYACVAHLGFILHRRSQELRESSSQKKEVGASISTKDIATDIPTRFIIREVEHFLKSRKLITEGVEQRAEAKRFLELIQVEAGLIVERGTDESGESLYGFVHRTFQEYFAAADVYERYQQEEDPTIISDFLREYLFDPHWHEVILLLLGKLKRKPTTVQLRQILYGKIKSRRSKYIDILQQDLFCVADCLNEEIMVESELAEEVVSRLSGVVKDTPFLSQQTEAIDKLGSLIRTHQYTNLALETLKILVTRTPSLDISTRL